MKKCFGHQCMSEVASSSCPFLQLAAMQAGLLKVVPQAVLDLLTWQEVEKKVCGDPEISVEALKRLSKFSSIVCSVGARVHLGQGGEIGIKKYQNISGLQPLNSELSLLLPLLPLYCPISFPSSPL